MNLPVESVYIHLQADHSTTLERDQARKLLLNNKEDDERDVDAYDREMLMGLASAPIMESLIERDRFHKKKENDPSDFHDILRNNRWIVILGDPGSGKTTFVRWLVSKYIKDVLKRKEAVNKDESHMQMHGHDSTSSDDDSDDVVKKKSKTGNNNNNNMDESLVAGSTRMPILIRVGEFAQDLPKESDLPLIDYIGYHTWMGNRMIDFSAEQKKEKQRSQLKKLQQALHDYIKLGYALIVLDGLDEIPESEKRSRVVRLVEEFVDSYVPTPKHVTVLDSQFSDRELDIPFQAGGNQLIITSRIAGYHARPLNGQFSHYTILRMQIDHMKEFVDHWFQTVHQKMNEVLQLNISSEAIKQKCEVQTDAMKAQLEKFKDSGLGLMASNPCLLNFLCLIAFHTPEAELPAERICLYDRIAKMMVKLWSSKEGKGLSRHPNIVDRLICDIAIYIHQNFSSGLIEKTNLLTVCRKSLQPFYESKKRTINRDSTRLIELFLNWYDPLETVRSQSSQKNLEILFILIDLICRGRARLCTTTRTSLTNKWLCKTDQRFLLLPKFFQKAANLQQLFDDQSTSSSVSNIALPMFLRSLWIFNDIRHGADISEITIHQAEYSMLREYDKNHFFALAFVSKHLQYLYSRAIQQGHIMLKRPYKDPARSEKQLQTLSFAHILCNSLLSVCQSPVSYASQSALIALLPLCRIYQLEHLVLALLYWTNKVSAHDPGAVKWFFEEMQRKTDDQHFSYIDGYNKLTEVERVEISDQTVTNGIQDAIEQETYRLQNALKLLKSHDTEQEGNATLFSAAVSLGYLCWSSSSSNDARRLFKKAMLAVQKIADPTKTNNNDEEQDKIETKEDEIKIDPLYTQLLEHKSSDIRRAASSILATICPNVEELLKIFNNDTEYCYRSLMEAMIHPSDINTTKAHTKCVVALIKSKNDSGLLKLFVSELVESVNDVGSEIEPYPDWSETFSRINHIEIACDLADEMPAAFFTEIDQAGNRKVFQRLLIHTSRQHDYHQKNACIKLISIIGDLTIDVCNMFIDAVVENPSTQAVCYDSMKYFRKPRDFSKREQALQRLDLVLEQLKIDIDDEESPLFQLKSSLQELKSALIELRSPQKCLKCALTQLESILTQLRLDKQLKSNLKQLKSTLQDFEPIIKAWEPVLSQLAKRLKSKSLNKRWAAANFLERLVQCHVVSAFRVQELLRKTIEDAGSKEKLWLRTSDNVQSFYKSMGSLDQMLCKLLMRMLSIDQTSLELSAIQVKNRLLEDFEAMEMSAQLASCINIDEDPLESESESDFNEFSDIDDGKIESKQE
ncbi:unnamed protein product [Rotaria sordida]|uniref:NACHT domain-containing protein n=2 Tax=Rotaria sordida TaxID=392033 RepID=A0A819LX55_9BILA|nr:unnamed protein product [Rotaria sordida]